MGDQPTSETPLLIRIADGSVDTREMYALYLTTVCYRLKPAEDGHEAILRARAMHPDVIVMDLHMPKLDGWAAIRELQGRAMTAAIPVIVLTGHDFKEYLKPAALAVGAVSYVTKPCLPEQLAREIKARLTARRSRGQLPADLAPSAVRVGRAQ